MRQLESIGWATTHLFWLVLGVSGLTFLYAVAAVPLVRHAFGVELPNPFMP